MKFTTTVAALLLVASSAACAHAQPGTPSARQQGNAPAQAAPRVSLGMGVNMENRGFPVVTQVRENSAAARAGVIVGDTLVAIDGRDPRIGRMFADMVPGERYTFTIHRAGQELRLIVVPDAPRSAPASP